MIFVRALKNISVQSYMFSRNQTCIDPFPIAIIKYLIKKRGSFTTKFKMLK
jgi:hypothetical protein